MTRPAAPAFTPPTPGPPDAHDYAALSLVFKRCLLSKIEQGDR